MTLAIITWRVSVAIWEQVKGSGTEFPGGCLSGLRLPEGFTRDQRIWLQRRSVTWSLTGRLSGASNRPLCLSLISDRQLPHEQGRGRGRGSRLSLLLYFVRHKLIVNGSDQHLPLPSSAEMEPRASCMPGKGSSVKPFPMSPLSKRVRVGCGAVPV